MKVRLLLLAAVAGGFVLWQTTADGGDKQEKKATPAFAGPKPGPEHKLLAKLKGKFNAKVTSWFEPGKPMESKAVTTRKVLMDGLFLQENHTGEFFGVKFRGMALLGYDTDKKKYFMAWIDNFGTGIMVNRGTYDPATKTWTYLGDEVSPKMGKLKTRDVFTVINDNEQRFEMYRTPLAKGGGQEFKVMEVLYTRAPEVKKKKKAG